MKAISAVWDGGVLNYYTYNIRKVVELLEGALFAMQPYRVVRVIADEGAAVLPVLKKLAAKEDRIAWQLIGESCVNSADAVMESKCVED